MTTPNDLLARLEEAFADYDPDAPTADDYEDVEQPVEAIAGAVSTAGGPNAASEALLELIGVVTKLKYVVAALDEDEFAVVRPWLADFRALVATLPTEPKPRRRVGFRPPVKKSNKGRKAGGKKA